MCTVIGTQMDCSKNICTDSWQESGRRSRHDHKLHAGRAQDHQSTVAKARGKNAIRLLNAAAVYNEYVTNTDAVCHSRQRQSRTSASRQRSKHTCILAFVHAATSRLAMPVTRKLASDFLDRHEVVFGTRTFFLFTITLSRFTPALHHSRLA